MLGGVSKFVLEVLPWALACLIAAFLLAGHVAPRPIRVELKPAPVAAVEVTAVRSVSS